MSAIFPPTIVEEARHPEGIGRIEAPRRQAQASNPLCGDEIELDVDDDSARIVAVAHRTRGCAFTRASASLLARTVPGLGLAEARELAVTLHRDLAGGAALPPALAALGSVRIYPARVRCALLPWEALRSALDAP